MPSPRRAAREICTLLGISVLGTSALVLSGALPASARQAPIYRLKLSGIYSPDLIQDQTTQKFADLIEQKTNGRVAVTVYPNAELGDEQQLPQTALAPNFRDITELSVIIMTTAEPRVGFTNLPFLFRDSKQIAEFQTSKTFEAQRDIMVKSKGLRMLAAWDYPAVGIYTNKPVTRLEDLKGLKIRVPPRSGQCRF